MEGVGGGGLSLGGMGEEGAAAQVAAPYGGACQPHATSAEAQEQSTLGGDPPYRSHQPRVDEARWAWRESSALFGSLG